MKFNKKKIKRAFVFFLTVLSFWIVSNPSASEETTYRIGPRDVVHISIHAGGEMQKEVDLTVSMSGMINVPFIGPVKASDLTVSELETAIKGPMEEDYFVNPELNVSIKEYHSLRYYISGAVKSPGMYEMTAETTLMKLIAKAGGLSVHRGNVAFVMRGDSNGKDQTQSKSEPIKVDLNKLLDQGDMTSNLVLHSGDLVYIPPEKKLDLAESNIYIEGEVKKPGVYPYQPGLTALNACIMAGGFDRYAAPNRARIVRKKEDDKVIIKIDLDEVKKGNIPDVELKPGDLVHIPETWL